MKFKNGAVLRTKFKSNKVIGINIAKNSNRCFYCRIQNYRCKDEVIIVFYFNTLKYICSLEEYWKEFKHATI